MFHTVHVNARLKPHAPRHAWHSPCCQGSQDIDKLLILFKIESKPTSSQHALKHMHNVISTKFYTADQKLLWNWAQHILQILPRSSNLWMLLWPLHHWGYHCGMPWKKIKPQETVQSFSLRSGARIRYKKVRFRTKHPSCVLLKDDGMICGNVKPNIFLTKEAWSSENTC